MSDPTPLLSLEQVGFTYSTGVRALQDVTLSVEQGAFLSLLGPSGCGKSTVLRLVAGLAQPSTGSLRWREPPARGSVGVVFQEPALMPWARVLENIRLPLDLAGVARNEGDERARRELDAVGLAGFADAYPRELSGGMRMRAALARALVTKPRLLLLDEPFAALDEITRQKLNDDLRALWQREGLTVLFVTHSVFESVYLSSHVAVMSARPGRIHGEMAVDLPANRDLDVRTGTAYGAQCRDVSALLAQAMAVAT